ncbi:recombinase family protein [Crocinitomicaceae bacterium CZZ-1]|uniref:Recombinase family protein n=1 Tax=Taishania pollutisoli TaxID=2766479 RepID=A0A8J6P5I6_9FLAO|nr:recombinase family protein [Taishania pollutisoli]MBC9812182.1 recombinase family protein [Taishania pollutisoli]
MATKSNSISKIESQGTQPKNGKLSVLYVRCSSIDQRTDRQRVNEGDFDWIIEDKISGNIEFFKRPGGAQLKKLIDDGIVSSISIWSIDRSGRNLLDILQTLKYCTEKNIQVNFLSQGLRTLDEDGKENPIAKMVISILGVIAEMQREQIREAQAQGIALAKARNAYHGRKQNTKETTADFLNKTKNTKALELLKKGYKGTEVSKIIGLSKTTVSKIKRLGLNK